MTHCCRFTQRNNTTHVQKYPNRGKTLTKPKAREQTTTPTKQSRSNIETKKIFDKTKAIQQEQPQKVTINTSAPSNFISSIQNITETKRNCKRKSIQLDNITDQFNLSTPPTKNTYKEHLQRTPTKNTYKRKKHTTRQYNKPI